MQEHTEQRRHEVRKTRLLMVDGNLTVNLRTREGGVSQRLYRDGYWGYAAAPGDDAAAAARVADQALRNARQMAHFGAKVALPVGGGAYVGEHAHAGRTPLTQKECIERLQELHAYCREHYPDVRSTKLLLADEHHSKALVTGSGGRSLSTIQRAQCYIDFLGEDEHGAPIELGETISGKGSLADLDISPEALAPRLDRLYEHLRAKRHAVTARGGVHTVVLGAELAGMLAHEAMGHPCEADSVLGGAVTADLVGRQIASPLITMVDFAHTYAGAEAMAPVYVDDEGTPARDATLIDRGVLSDFMTSRETAARLGIARTGSARAYGPNDEPLVRMRNTAILPGRDRLEAMIEGVDDGYLLLKTGNGQADSTTEFMFGIGLGYEIRGGRLGRAIRDTTLSGSALSVLSAVDAVSDEMHWDCSGYCGKKQLMVVAMGGPALRTRAQLGGE